jgi:hypothetical protein
LKIQNIEIPGAKCVFSVQAMMPSKAAFGSVLEASWRPVGGSWGLSAVLGSAGGLFWYPLDVKVFKLVSVCKKIQFSGPK